MAVEAFLKKKKKIQESKEYHDLTEKLGRLSSEKYENYEMVRVIRSRHSQFFDHVMRRNKSEYLVTTGKVDGKMAKDKAKYKLPDGCMP